MEHFFRDHQRKVKVLQASAIFLFFAALGPSALAADQKASQTASSLDFANGLYARKMYGPAITEYEKFLRSNPGSPEAAAARFRYADAHYFSKDYAGAIAHFELFLKTYPEDKRVPLANFRMSTARYYQGDRARAIRGFVRLAATAQDPLIRCGAKFYLAKSLESKGQEEKGLRLLEKLVKESPQNEYASYAGVSIGDHHLRNGNFGGALHGYLITAVNQNPSDLTRLARFKVAEIHFSQKNYSEAAGFYQKVFKESPKKMTDDLKMKSLLGLFYCDYNISDLAGAERRLSENRPLVESSAYLSEILFLLASLQADGKKYEESLKNLDEILLDKNSDETLREKAGFKKVSVLSQKGEKDLSLKELEKIFTGTSKSADRALFEKAELLAEIGKTDDALAAYQQVVQQYPDSEYAKNALYRSAIARMKAGQTDAAKADLKEYALHHSLDPNADLALLQIVQIDLDAKKFNEAFEAAEKFIKEHSSSPILDIAYYKLGVAATGS